MDVASILRFFFNIFLFDFEVFELEGQFIDGDHMFSRKVLQCSS